MGLNYYKLYFTLLGLSRTMPCVLVQVEPLDKQVHKQGMCQKKVSSFLSTGDQKFSVKITFS